VPQGSILGPLLILLYVNDISIVSKILHFILFAGETYIFLSDHNAEKLVATANAELNELSPWFLANCLCIKMQFCGILSQLKHPHKTTLIATIIIAVVELLCLHMGEL